jgi:hypothetical protein
MFIYRHIFPFLLSVVLVVGLATPGLAKIVLISAQGPNASKYPVGSVFPDTKEFDLRSGDVLTILDSKGTRTLRGPFKGRINSTPSTKVAPVSLHDVLIAANEKRWRVAALRNLPTDTTTAVTEESRKRTPIDNLWQLELGYQGDWCVPNGEEVSLSRKQAELGDELRVIDETGVTRSTRWRAGDSSVPWPGDEPPTDGQTYTISTTSNASSLVTVHLLESSTDEVPEMARYFLDHNCFAQLDFLGSAVE